MDGLVLPPGKARADRAEGLDAKGELVSLAHPSPLSGPI